VLEHGAGDDLVDLLALQGEAGDQAVDGCGEHRLVGLGGVGAVRAGERDPVAAEDGRMAWGGHGYIISCTLDRG
jgi:hypothetical protein